MSDSITHARCDISSFLRQFTLKKNKTENEKKLCERINSGDATKKSRTCLLVLGFSADDTLQILNSLCVCRIETKSHYCARSI